MQVCFDATGLSLLEIEESTAPCRSNSKCAMIGQPF